MAENASSLKDEFVAYLHTVQNNICAGLEEIDGKSKFHEDAWERPGGGGGRSRVIENGNVFEKGGVNFSAVHGELPDAMKKHFNVSEGYFFASGVSLVLHPENPYAPTVHANWRYFELYEDASLAQVKDCWFGGGTDLTPYLLFEEDAEHFHRVHKAACDKHDPDFYPRFKKVCDEYFYNAHRGEARGIGGLFFDYLRPEPGRSARDWFAFVKDASDVFLDAYLPIVEKRKDAEYTDEERYFQEIRRGRYVEFNLIHDRGTLFGLKTNGRIESILMSLPPRVRWDYNFDSAPNERAKKLLEVLRKPREWV